MEVLALDAAPGGQPPACWLPRREGELARPVLTPAGGSAWLLTSWEAVSEALTGPHAPFAYWPHVITAHPWRWPDFNTLPPPGHSVLRPYYVRHVTRDASVAAVVRPAARALAARLPLRAGPVDLVAHYVQPLVGAVAVAQGFPPEPFTPPASEPWVRSWPDVAGARSGLADLLEHCAAVYGAQLASPGVKPLERMAAAMRRDGWPAADIVRAYRVASTAVKTPADPLAGVLWERLLRHPGTISELVRTRWHFGLMNPRTLGRPVELSDGTVIGKGKVVIPSMRAALRDEAHWGPGAGQVQDGDYDRAEPFGWGPYGCPAYHLGWEVITAGAEELEAAWPRAVLHAVTWKPGMTGAAPATLLAVA
jgi:cytochrome P450